MYSSQGNVEGRLVNLKKLDVYVALDLDQNIICQYNDIQHTDTPFPLTKLLCKICIHQLLEILFLQNIFFIFLEKVVFTGRYRMDVVVMKLSQLSGNSNIFYGQF